MQKFKITMTDGYSRVENAQTEGQARRLAIAHAIDDSKTCAITDQELMEATTIEFIEWQGITY